MAIGERHGILEHLRKTMLLRDGSGLPDGQLLRDYLSRRDEAALAILVQRHGPMVWGVCRRILSHHHDAEDAFQATFLVLVRKAASISAPEQLANWLYGVAHLTALKARAAGSKRKGRERQVTDMPEPAIVEPDRWSDLQPVLDQELSRLPDIYRGVIVLCDLEGKTRKQAARDTGLPEGTIGSRLARAREMLARRLTQRGIALSGAALATLLASNAATAGVPGSVVTSTIAAVNVFAAGNAVASGAISARAAALTEGVLKAMMMSKLKAIVAVLLVLAFVVTGAAVLSSRTSAATGGQPAVQLPAKPVDRETPDQEKEAETAWGKEINGLQAGLGYPRGEKRAYHFGEGVRVVARIRNLTREAIEFEHIWAFFVENPPKIIDPHGKVVQMPRFAALGLQAPRSTKVLPGREVELYDWAFDLDQNWKAHHGPGTFTLQCERIVGPTSGNPVHPNPKLDKLATGKLELEVKEAKKPDQEKETPTAWGLEVDGLQAGLTLKGADTYRHGESVKLEVKLRNLGKAEVKVTYGLLSREVLPSVTDADGVRMTVVMPLRKGYKVRVTDRVLKPGETITLYNPIIDVQSTDPLKLLGELRVDTPTMYVPPGKYRVAFAGMLQSHLKLTTGAVSIVVQERAKPDPRSGGARIPEPRETPIVEPPVKLDTRITIEAVVEKVNAGSLALTVSARRKGVIDGQPKPLRLEDLSVSKFATIRANGKEITLADLKPGVVASLGLDGRETTLTVVSIEVHDIRKEEQNKIKPDRTGDE